MVRYFFECGLTTRRKAQMSTERIDLYQKVTDQIIAQLERGTVPWVRPWTTGASGRIVALPHNSISGRPYSGVNIPLLWMRGAAYQSNGWLTFKQALGAGGAVRRGEHGTMVVYADKFIPQSEKARIAGTDEKARPVYFLKGYTVFNTEQCDGLKPEPIAAAPTMPQMIESADTLIRNSHARVTLGGDRAFYALNTDSITMPVFEAYPERIDWYRTMLHEMAHWTGADHRLKRQFGQSFGDSNYAREELIAEMSAAFACASMGIEPTLRHADYLASWLRVLREDKRAIVQAASKASKASDYLLAFNETESVAEAAD